MNPAIHKYLEAASSFTTMTTEKAEKVIRQLVRSGEAAGDQMGEMVDDLIDRQRKNQEAINSLVKSETSRAVRAMGVASSEDLEHVQDQVADLRREVDRLRSAADPAEKSAAKKSAAKKTAKKSAAKKTAKKSAAKKTAKKSAGKKATTSASRKATGSSNSSGS